MSKGVVQHTDRRITHLPTTLFHYPSMTRIKEYTLLLMPLKNVIVSDQNKRNQLEMNNMTKIQLVDIYCVRLTKVPKNGMFLSKHTLQCM